MDPAVFLFPASGDDRPLFFFLRAMTSYLIHPSGGLPYHLRAWRWRRTLWAPFHQGVEEWLADWRPASRHLVLVGPSGGYALTPEFLAGFQRWTVLEPDPLARRLLRRRFPGVALEFADSSWLPGAAGLRRLAATWPRAAFLFCNLLGQALQGEAGPASRRDWLAGLAPALAGREWASWHDLASTARPPDRQPVLTFPRALPLDEVLARYWQGGVLEVVDHDTAGLCPDQPRRTAIWRLAPGSWHLVEWVAAPPLG